MGKFTYSYKIKDVYAFKPAVYLAFYVLHALSAEIHSVHSDISVLN